MEDCTKRIYVIKIRFYDHISDVPQCGEYTTDEDIIGYTNFEDRAIDAVKLLTDKYNDMKAHSTEEFYCFFEQYNQFEPYYEAVDLYKEPKDTLQLITE